LHARSLAALERTRGLRMTHPKMNGEKLNLRFLKLVARG
jgi:hypothetical protein